MNIEFYLIILGIFLFYFISKYENIRFEIILIITLIWIGPIEMFKDLPNYLLDIKKFYPFFDFPNSSTYLIFLYGVIYSLVYFLISKNLKHKVYRLGFFILTFGTLGYNQILLTIAILFFLLQDNTKNKYLRYLLIVLSLISHLSIIPFYSLYIYVKNKSLFLIICALGLLLTFINPNFYLYFSEYDYRIELYTQLNQYGDNYKGVFATYNIRSQIFTHVLMLIFSLVNRNVNLVLFTIFILLFSIFAQSLHAVFIYRFVELFYIMYFFILQLEENKIKHINLGVTIIFIVFFVNNFFQSFLILN